jgi:non-canonical purine NTP pyrophosphatase (RdgB/HAM1 family)
MKPILYVTGNVIKFRQAAATLKSFDITAEQASLDVPEIQAASGEPVARDKAVKTFAQLGKPLVVSDDSWIIPGLGGFPGPYMKYMNDWFTAEDWLRLTNTLEDRRIILRQIVVYQNADDQQLFTVDIPGILLHEIRGTTPFPQSAIVSFDGGKHSNAQYHEKGESAAAHHHNPWHEFAKWYKEHA